MWENLDASIFCYIYSGKLTKKKSIKKYVFIGLNDFFHSLPSIFSNRVIPSESQMNLFDHKIDQYHLWSSVCSNLCACVNNPQNGNYFIKHLLFLFFFTVNIGGRGDDKWLMFKAHFVHLQRKIRKPAVWFFHMQKTGYKIVWKLR